MTGSENDLFVKRNIRKIPWWLTADRLERGALWVDDSVYMWSVPESRSVRALRRGGKSHHGKVRPVPCDFFPSTTIREAIERWGR